MVFNTGAALLDAIVLAVVSKDDQGTYGYRITQDVRRALEVSEWEIYSANITALFSEESPGEEDGNEEADEEGK